MYNATKGMILTGSRARRHTGLLKLVVGQVLYIENAQCPILESYCGLRRVWGQGAGQNVWMDGRGTYYCLTSWPRGPEKLVFLRKAV